MTEEEIESAKITHIDEKNSIIEWSGSKGFGRLTLKYLDNGRYELDSEYLKIESVINIIKKVKL